MKLWCRSETRKCGIYQQQKTENKEPGMYIYIYVCVCVRTIEYRNSTKTERCREMIVAKDEKKNNATISGKSQEKKKEGKCEQILSR